MKNKTENDWQAEDDARCLMQAKTLETDSKRYDRALKKLDDIKNDNLKKAQAAANILNSKSPKKKETPKKNESLKPQTKQQPKQQPKKGAKK
jgi:hypothetical protein